MRHSMLALLLAGCSAGASTPTQPARATPGSDAGAATVPGGPVEGGGSDGGSGPAPSPSASPSPDPTSSMPPPGGFQKVGYFPQWGIYGRQFYLKNVADTEADKLDTLIYAFENLDPVNLTCLMTTHPSDWMNPQNPDEGNGAGDQFADYDRSFMTGQSVDGTSDQYNDPIRGNFKQLKQLKAKYPNLKVTVSLGGWTYSHFFSDVAASDAARQKFVASCIDLYIKGNLPVANGVGGPGTAAGIFDGIDLDWEWPGTVGHVGNHVSAADKQNFPLLLAEFRKQLDALGGKHYTLTAFLPADPAKIAAGVEVSSVLAALDYANIQGYDFHGAGSDNSWEPHQTNHGAQLSQPPGDPSTYKFSGEAAIAAYLSAGAPAAKLTLGVPFYGQGWTGVADGGTHGLYQAATGAARGSQPGADGVLDYKLLKARFPTPLHDELAIAAYGFDGTEFWSFDDPWVIGKKAEFIKAKGLRGAMIWSLDSDDGTLTTALDAALR